ncbi:MAG: hypothetical protein HY580_07865 [Nitrospinae bacterium]|nr:hypothetical protein [Nitrospinota bacterium]
MNIYKTAVSVLIAGFLALAISACGEQKKKAEERGKNMTQPLKDAQKDIDAATAKIQEQTKSLDQAGEDAGKE